MSGKKMISISNTRYEELLRNERRLRNIQDNLPNIIRQIMDRGFEEIQQQIDPLQRRQQALERSLSNAVELIREVETRTTQNLQNEFRRSIERMKKETEAKLSSLDKNVENGIEREKRERQRQIESVQEMLQSRIDEERRNREAQIHDAVEREKHERQRQIESVQEMLQSRIDEERRNREAQIQQLQHQINLIVSDKERLRIEVSRWLESVHQLLNFVKVNYRHNQFTPGRIETLERDLNQAERNFSGGILEGAIVQVQKVYHDLSDLRMQLEKIEMEWTLWRGIALQQAQEVLALLDRNRKAKATDVDGKELDTEIDVDWWTNGQLKELEQELQATLKRIQEDTNITIQEFQDIANSKLPSMKKRLEDLVAEARIAVLSSQLRINIADLVVQTLEAKGFSLQDSTYEGEDMRSSFVAQLKHIDGSEVVVVVSPQADRPHQNELHIHSFDKTPRSESELRRRAEEIAVSLHRYGLNVKSPEKVGDKPDPLWRNIKAIRERKIERPTTQRS